MLARHIVLFVARAGRLSLLAGPPGRPLRGAILWVGSLIIVFSFTAYVAAQFHGAGKTFFETFGLGMNERILIGAGVVVGVNLVLGFDELAGIVP